MKFFQAAVLLLPSLASASNLRNAPGTDALLPALIEQQAPEGRRLQICNDQCVTIELVFHLLQNPSLQGPTATKWTDDQIAKEILNLNSVWAGTPFRFAVREKSGINRYTNAAYSTANLLNDFEAKTITKEIRIGGRTTANILISDDPNICGPGGFATIDFNMDMFPDDVFTENDKICFCGINTFGVNTYILSHELGHWLSLAHPWENGCGGAGDGVGDTPDMAGPFANTCVANQDSCPGQPGFDPIDNIMGYTSCPNQKFTEGQKTKMFEYYEEFRALTKPCASGEGRLGFEFLFDNNANDNRLQIIKWGIPPSPLASLIFNGNNGLFNGKAARYSVCFPQNKVYELRFFDTSSNGLQSPGFFKYLLNGKEVYRGGVFSGKNFDGVLVAGDAEVCGAGEGRIGLKMIIGGNPSATTWSIRNAAGSVVIDQSATTAAGRTEYIPNWSNYPLFFDQCLPAGAYTFSVSNQSGNYELLVNGELKVTSAAATSSIVVTGAPVRTPRPTPPPTMAPPTPAPTLSVVATPVPTLVGGGFICFSGSSTVEVLNRGQVDIKEIEIGDQVHVGDGRYEAVYSFGHRNTDVTGKFLEIKTNASKLQLSKDHMVFSASDGAIAGSLLKVGDKLVDAHGNHVVVKSIKEVSSTGAIAPFTPSGKIVVDGILASSFVAFGNGAHLTVGGVAFSYQWMAHAFEVPHRLMCIYLTQCTDEKYTVDGISTWVQGPHQLWLWILKQSVFVQSIAGVFAIILFAVLNLLEFCVLNPVTVCVGVGSLWKCLKSGVKSV